MPLGLNIISGSCIQTDQLAGKTTGSIGGKDVAAHGAAQVFEIFTVNRIVEPVIITVGGHL